jgi:hypothetical protein
VVSTPRAIQGLIIFSAALGVAFLWLVYGLVPASVFDFVAFGWALFVVDGVLTFVRPLASYYLGFVLSLVALAATLTEPAHYSLVQSGNFSATVVIISGSVAEVLLIALVPYHLLSERRKGKWAWPGAK